MVSVRPKAAVLVALVVVLSVLVGSSGAPAVASSSPANPVSPYGANDWGCRPDAAHPSPVILVHGTYGDQQTLFDYLSWYVSDQGYCVFALDYGFYGTNAVARSATELAKFVDEVLAATGAAKVSIIGHSQGGALARYYVKQLGGADLVEDLVGIAPANHGTTWKGLLTLVPGFWCQACFDLMADSPFLAGLNQGDESPGAVSYTNIVSKYDTVLVPTTSGYLAPAPNVSNIRIQDSCPGDQTNHVYLPLDPVVIRIAVDALAHSGPASAAYRPKCGW